MLEARPRFDSIAAHTRTEIQAVLTPEQQEEFGEIAKQMECPRGGRRPHGP